MKYDGEISEKAIGEDSKDSKRSNKEARAEAVQRFTQGFDNLDLVSISAEELKLQLKQLSAFKFINYDLRREVEPCTVSDGFGGRTDSTELVLYYTRKIIDEALDIAKIPNAQIIARLLETIQKQDYMDENIEQYNQLKLDIDTSKLETVQAFTSFIESSKISSGDWASYQPLRRDAVIQNVFDSIEREEPTPKIFSGLRAMMPNASIWGYAEPVLNAVKETLYRQFEREIAETISGVSIPVDEAGLNAALDTEIVNVFVPQEKRTSLVNSFLTVASGLEEQRKAIAVLTNYPQIEGLREEFKRNVTLDKGTLLNKIVEVAGAAKPEPLSNVPA